VLEGDTEQDQVWRDCDEWLMTKYMRGDGVVLQIERTFVDMQFRTQRVLAFCAPRLARGIFPCRGINRVGISVPPILPAKPSRNNKARIPHWNVGVTVAKAAIFDRLALHEPGPRYLHFPHGHGFDADHFKQLTVEKRKIRYSYGQAYAIFEKTNSTQRNEALDIAVYALAALHSLMPIGWGKLAANRLATLPERAEDEDADAQDDAGPVPQATMQPQPTPARYRPPARPFATSW